MSFLANNKRRSALIGAVAAMAATAGVVATATPAAAQGNVFVYANYNYSIPVYPSGAPVYVTNLTGIAKDSISSVGVTTDHGMCFYEHANFGGLEFKVGRGEWWAQVPSWINDKISSYRPC
ncbi:hypothetical protein AB0O01_16835 [Streptomyces sp. NPDC093252]|uniref:hypothetical protein n=1 Tax=Streptomyces sp. NPDC093252 TaxID=3154980 RepID=UPI0034357397